MDNYRYLIIGGDKRQEYLFNILKKQNLNVETLLLKREDKINKNLDIILEYNIIILPIPSSTDGIHLYTPTIKDKVFLNEITSKISEDAILFTGGENFLFTACKAKKVINILADESMTLKNAMATAEATLSIILEETEHTIFGSKILIIGYGRIAEILSTYLTSLKATVDICARKEIARTKASLLGANPFGFDKLCEKLSNYQIVINTVPNKILNKTELLKINPAALIIDLASKPGGVDFDTANQLGLNVIHALSLPGKYSPFSAAEYIEQTIKNTL